MIQTMTKSEFDKQKPFYGVYVFLNGESCSLCEQYLATIKKQTLVHWNVVLLNDESSKDLLRDYGVYSVPLTRVYYDSMIVYEKGGVLYETQINEVIKHLEELDL